MTGVENLSDGAFVSPIFPVQGIIYGTNRRLMINLNCKLYNKENAPIIKVWFIVNTGSNYTWVDEKTIAKLKIMENIPSKLLLSIQVKLCISRCTSRTKLLGVRNFLVLVFIVFFFYIQGSEFKNRMQYVEESFQTG